MEETIGSAVVAELRAEVTGGRVIAEPALMEPYRRDATRVVAAGVPMAVVEARGVGDVIATMRWASSHRVPLVTRGGGTSLV